MRLSSSNTRPLEFMDNYHELMIDIITDGQRQFNKRTGKVCIMLPGAMLQYDLRVGYPAVTTKKLAFGQVKGELCGFMRGATSAAEFRELGCTIWDANANQNAAWLANPNRKGDDDLGRVYGAQWTNWQVDRSFPYGMPVPQEEGWKYASTESGGDLYCREINQLEQALHMLRTDPSNRRIIVNGWNPGELDLMALPPCHVLYQFIADTDKRVLHMCMYQRSCDMFLGVPFNIASSALLLSIMARLSGFEAGQFTHFLADAHIYEDHVDQVRVQLDRTPFAPPQLMLDIDPLPAPDLSLSPQEQRDVIKGVFAAVEPRQIRLDNYQSHDAIRAPMAV